MSSSVTPSKISCIRIHQHGDPSVLQYEEVELIPPNDEEVCIEVAYSGVNYIDTYHRTGLYKVELPFRVGREGAGRIAQIGKKVKNLQVGDRVCFANATGSYATYVNVSESSVLPVPAHVPLRTAAACLLQGLTAHYLLFSSFKVEPSVTILVHAAAGGTGSLLVQWAKSLGARVIATVGSNEKAKLVSEQLGADHVINYNENTQWWDEVRKLTNDQGVHAVYDGVGKATYEGSLKSLRKRGYLVLFGNASGAVPPIDPLALTKHGSVYLTRPTMMDYLLTPEEVRWRASDLFTAIEKSQLKINVGAELPLNQASKAHQLIESRGIAGKILLTVNNNIQ